MTAAERGLVLLCCALGDRDAKPLTMAQFRELSSRMQTADRQGAPDDQVDEALLERLGYSGEMAQRMVYLLSREARLETYLEEALEVGCYPVTPHQSVLSSGAHPKTGRVPSAGVFLCRK